MNACLAISASLMLERTRRETFLLRLRLYVQMIRGANAAISQHGMLDSSPAAVVLVGKGYATVRRDGASSEVGPAGTLQSSVESVGRRIDLHRSPTVVVSTTGLQRVIDGLQSAFQRRGLPWASTTMHGRSGSSVAGGSEDGILSGSHEASPMLEHTGRDLVRSLGVCPEDTALAYWALFCTSERQEDAFREAAIAATKRRARYSASLSHGLAASGAFGIVGKQRRRLGSDDTGEGADAGAGAER